MRKLALLTALTLMSLTLSARAAPDESSRGVSGAPASASSAPVSDALAESMASPRPPLAISPPLPAYADAQACRQGCAQTYYFCMAGETPEECPEAWSRCAVGCAVPDFSGGGSADR